MLEGIQYKDLEHLLIGDPDLDRLTWRAVLTVPHLNKRDINGSPGPTRPQVEGTRSPQESYTIGCVISIERCVT